VRASPWALSEKFFAESKKKFSAQIKTLGEEILKKTLLHLQTFSIINMHLYKGYVKI
jgi:hypothetical protein